MLYISAAYAVVRCLFVCLAAWLAVSHTILVFQCQTAWRYSDGDPPNGGVACRWGRQKTVLSTVYESKSVKNKAATDGGER